MFKNVTIISWSFSILQTILDLGKIFSCCTEPRFFISFESFWTQFLFTTEILLFQSITFRLPLSYTTFQFRLLVHILLSGSHSYLGFNRTSPVTSVMVSNPNCNQYRETLQFLSANRRHWRSRALNNHKPYHHFLKYLLL